MCPILRSSLLTFAAVALMGAQLGTQLDPSWKIKSIPQWDQQDAKTVLAESPWVKMVKLDKVRDLSVFERRDGGDWDAGVGPDVGLAGTGIFGTYKEILARQRAHERRDLGSVVVRWESALPIRAAEVKVGEIGAPAWEGDYYAIAVYDVPPPFRWNLANELKGVAYLQRDKKKDLKPSRVQMLRHDDTGLATVVYLFPRSAEITKKDHNVRFMAQIGRLFVSQFFFPEDMQYQGQPEL